MVAEEAAAADDEDGAERFRGRGGGGGGKHGLFQRQAEMGVGVGFVAEKGLSCCDRLVFGETRQNFKFWNAGKLGCFWSGCISSDLCLLR